MLFEKTYPPEVQAAREQWLRLMENAADQFTAGPTSTATEVRMRQQHMPPEAIEQVKRDLDAATKPMRDALVQLEAYATLKWTLSAEETKGLDLNSLKE
jgi:hypothetical protein